MSPASKEADALRRPVGREGLADDPLGGDWSPESTVVRGATVVAHHEVVVGWNRDLGREVAALAAAAGLGEVFLLQLAVELDAAVQDADLVARPATTPLVEVAAARTAGGLADGL